jgi:mRNA-degrading endonuclease RelE of RelBE toxin-antitoxin system
MNKKIKKLDAPEANWILMPLNDFNKDLNALSEEIKIKALVQIKRLENAKTFTELGNVEKIQSANKSANEYRMKFGNYRILFEWEKSPKNSKVLVLTALMHRKDAYKKK